MGACYGGAVIAAWDVTLSVVALEKIAYTVGLGDGPTSSKRKMPMLVASLDRLTFISRSPFGQGAGSCLSSCSDVLGEKPQWA